MTLAKRPIRMLAKRPATTCLPPVFRQVFLQFANTSSLSQSVSVVAIGVYRQALFTRPIQVYQKLNDLE